MKIRSPKKCLLCCGDNTTTGRYCNHCSQYLRKHPEGLYPLPKAGRVEYADNGDPICHICGEAHRKLGSHIAHKHFMTQNEYRDKFKLYRNTKLSNYEYRKKMLEYNNTYKEKVVKENLLEKGKKTRITKERVFETKRKYGRPIPEVFSNQTA